MASPIRHALSPKVLMPKLKSSTLKVDGTSFINTGSGNTIKSLKCENRHSSIDIAKISIQVPKRNCEPLLINTPNKNKLLKNGVWGENLQILGQGSFGVVIKGIYRDNEVAVKIIKLRSSHFLRESNAINLIHENIVKVVDLILNYNENHGIVIMEYCRGARHLQSILENQENIVNPIDILKYALNICRGLQYSHSKNVLHLDLKPSNILVCDNGVCKICDFGNSVNLENIEETYEHQGTVAYTAPEILMGGRPTTKCDVYSLGILLWQMRYKRTPYNTFDNAQVVIYKVVKFNLRPTAGNLDNLTDKYSSVYTKCWSSKPSDRPEIKTIIEDLNSCQSSLM